MSSCCYFVKDAEIRPDGVLRIRTAGVDGGALWDGDFEVAPGDQEYEFWLWLKRRLARRWFGPAGVDEQAIAKYREEFKSACANQNG
jgi:hypothetical protein